jgi:transcriptional regulator with XRE-family HTH domain
MTIGEKIFDRRRALGLTQIQLAEAIGVTSRAVYSYENNGVIPRGNNRRRLCEVLGISQEYLMNDKITDPKYGLEEAEYVDSVRSRYGKKGAMDVQEMLDGMSSFFAGGDVPQEDKDLFFQAVVNAYMQTKQDAHDKFTPKKYQK